MKRLLWIGIVLGYAALAVAGPVKMVKESVLDRAGAAPAAEAEAAGPAADGGTTVLMQGLKFAPAGTSDQTYYTALYQSMLSYDSGLIQLARR